jgi:sugar phosphate isomerase/epimerase
MRTVIVLLLLICCSLKQAYSQKVRNDFFALHNIIRGDSIYNTFDKQVSLIKSAGYDGIEINQVESFEGMKEALEKHSFKAAYFYVKINLDTPYMDKRLEGYIRQLKGTKTIIAPFILSNSRLKPGNGKADTLVVQLMQQLAGWAKPSGLQVAIYPHLGFYVERTDHALRLVQSIHQKNVGLSFNLCHWLATTAPEERSRLKSHLKELQPNLKMITVSGANDVISKSKNVWDDYILPLGEGTFNTYGLLKYCIKDLKLKVPVGVQCYNIKTDKYQLVKNTMTTWKQYKNKLETDK